MLMFLLYENTAAVSSRQAAAFETLYSTYHGPILHYLQQLCGSADQAEDLAQETFVKAYVGLVTFRGDSSAATWLYRIARNTYLNSQRRAVTVTIDESMLHTMPDTAPDSDPAKQAVANEQRFQIERTLAQLPEQQRSILLLRDAAGLSYIEIADVLGITVAAVRMKLFRARNAFRLAYGGLDMEGRVDEL